MRIGIMLRHLDQHGGGVLVYTENLLRELLTLETDHEFVLIYRDPAFLGRFADHERVREVAVASRSVLSWDQLAMRRVVGAERLDMIFNPKYSVPLTVRCPTVFVCHGLDWYVMPWGSRLVDRLSHKFLISRYAAKAAAIIANSDTTREHLIEYLGVDERRIHTAHLGVDERFFNPATEQERRQVREQHRLPEKFFLYCGQIYPPKNFGRLLQAYAQVGPDLGISLVVAGAHTWLCEDEVGLIERLGIEDWVLRTGWVERDVLPALYAEAHALLLPSLYESFGLPILEAMASGCPVLTSDRYGTREIAGDAALLVDPEELSRIAEGMSRVATDDELRGRLTAAGLERARGFTWAAVRAYDARGARQCAQSSSGQLTSSPFGGTKVNSSLQCLEHCGVPAVDVFQEEDVVARVPPAVQ